MGSADSGDIEDLIRTAALTKRIRSSELFLDYDRLRSGNVTGNLKQIYIKFTLNHVGPDVGLDIMSLGLSIHLITK